MVLPSPSSRGFVVNETQAGARRGEVFVPRKGDGHGQEGEKDEREDKHGEA